ncbi:response regulator transcription factor [Serratia marcescens]|uniref:response regulator transcription factor n=1 Tax=Serratia marcescens TaxID=615 RepID=UPI003EE1E867
MKSTVRILIDETNQYFSYGFMSALTECLHEQGVCLNFTHTVCDKIRADIVFVSAEQNLARLRYLSRRQDAPAHQRIFLFKEKPNAVDKLIYKNLDGVFYRYQSLNWAKNLIIHAIKKMPTVSQCPPHSIEPYLFTERETKILHYLATGLRACEISRILAISPKTVSAHKRNAMVKLGCRRVSDLNYWLLSGELAQSRPLSRMPAQAETCSSSGFIVASHASLAQPASFTKTFQI